MIDWLGDIFQHNLIVLAAVVLLPLKWLVLRFCKDNEAEVGAIIAVPEDLCYVGVGLVLGDIVNNAGAFRRHFAHSQHLSMDLLITVALSFGVAIVAHVFSQKGSRHLKSWRAAIAIDPNSQEAASQGQLELPMESRPSNFTLIGMGHLAFFGTWYCFQFALVGSWFYWITKVMQGD
jgi:hypothetical protein